MVWRTPSIDTDARWKMGEHKESLTNLNWSFDNTCRFIVLVFCQHIQPKTREINVSGIKQKFHTECHIYVYKIHIHITEIENIFRVSIQL